MAVNSGDILEVVLSGDFDGASEVVNVFQFRKIDSGTISDAEALSDLEELFDALLAVLVTLLTNETVIRRIKAYLFGTSTIIGEVIFATPYTGTAAGDPCPAGVAFLTTFPTAVSRVQPRKYWGVPAEVFTDGVGQVTTAGLDILADIVVQLTDPYLATNGLWEFGHWTPVTESWISLVDGFVLLEPAYQRRRRRGVGS